MFEQEMNVHWTWIFESQWKCNRSKTKWTLLCIFKSKAKPRKMMKLLTLARTPTSSIKASLYFLESNLCSSWSFSIRLMLISMLLCQWRNLRRQCVRRCHLMSLPWVGRDCFFCFLLNFQGHRSFLLVGLMETRQSLSHLFLVAGP